MTEIDLVIIPAAYVRYYQRNIIDCIGQYSFD